MKDLDKLKVNKEQPKLPRKKKLQQEASEEVKFYLELLRKRNTFKNLTPKEKLFVINYCLYQGDWEKAMVMSGLDSPYYSKQGARYLQKEKIQNAIEDFWSIIMGDKITLIKNKVVDQLFRIAFTDRSKYFNSDGSLKEGMSLDDLGEDECLIDGVERKFYGKDADVSVLVYKMADRAGARRDLIKMFSLDSTSYGKKSAQTTGVLRVPTKASEDEWEKM